MKMVPFLFFGVFAVIMSTGVECGTTSAKEDVNLKSQCSVHSDCADSLACINRRCVDPCKGTCGLQAECNVVNHNPICTCSVGYTGDPFTHCVPVPKVEMSQDAQHKPECVLNSDCTKDKACLRNKCANPCDSGTCASNALCTVHNHIPGCTCPNGTEGNAFFQCEPIGQQSTRDGGQVSPCTPTPCGHNSQCREMNGHAVCSCLPGFVGSPPTCRPECTVNTDCASNQACVNKKCIKGGESVIDDGARPACYQKCGRNEECRENENGVPSCGCKPGYMGTLSFGCVGCETKFNCALNQTCDDKLECVDPCLGYCGPNDDCYVFNHKAGCRPKGSHPECSSNTDCSTNKACDGYKCIDPCLDLCSDERADCKVVEHEPVCSCKEGFYGSPYRFCFTNGSVE